MVNRITLIFAMAVIWAFPKAITAQHQHHAGCGTTFQDQELIKERLFENRRNKAELLAAFDAARANRSANDSTLWVPVVFHMCSRSDGTGQRDDNWVLQEMCYFNQNFADQNIQFYLQGINRFNSNQMYVNDEDNSDYIRSIHRVNNVVNIYVAGPAVGGTQYGAYYAPNWDWIFTWNDIYNWGLSHEVGHLFTLPHTFNGWEGTDYATESAASGKAPMMGTNGRPVEKVARGISGENCQYAADGFCDTPPDYASGGGGCAMPSNWRDPDSVLVSPSSIITNNYMSYFFCTPKSFTQDQKDAIKLDVIRRWNASQAAPNPLNVSGTPTLVWPEQGSLAPYTNSLVNFRWSDSANNGMYMFTLEKTLNNGGLSLGIVAEYVVYGTETWVNLEPNREYRWKVRALTKYELCNNNPSATSTSAVFTTADWNVGTQSIEASIQNSKVYPNPATQNSNVIVEMEVPYNGEASLSITNLLGQEVMPMVQLNLVSGKNIELINVKDLNSGVYFVNINSGTNRISHKLMIQE
jgi:hypothetical protein